MNEDIKSQRKEFSRKIASKLLSRLRKTGRGNWNDIDAVRDAIEHLLNKENWKPETQYETNLLPNQKY